MLETLTVDTFKRHLDETFHLVAESSPPAALRLIEATPVANAAGQQRVPFSIIFRGPHDVVFPQRIYRLEHAAMGAFELFLVPIGPDAEGMRYEAVFT